MTPNHSALEHAFAAMVILMTAANVAAAIQEGVMLLAVSAGFLGVTLLIETAIARRWRRLYEGANG